MNTHDKYELPPNPITPMLAVLIDKSSGEGTADAIRQIIIEFARTAIEPYAKRIAELEAARIAYASEFPPNQDGEPDVGSIHENIRKLKADRKGRGEPVELQGVAEAISNGDGFWRSCTGCHETNGGYDTGPYSKTLKCHLGIGCSECGGIGAVWDDTDYDAMADYMARGMGSQQPAEPVKVPSDDDLEELMGRFVGYSGCIHDDAFVDCARALLASYGGGTP